MENIYVKKLAKLNLLVGNIHDALVQVEELYELERREGDREYAEEVFGAMRDQLGAFLSDAEGEKDATEALVDTSNAFDVDVVDPRSERPGFFEGDVVADKQSKVDGFVTDVEFNDKKEEYYVTFDTGSEMVTAPASQLRLVQRD